MVPDDLTQSEGKHFDALADLHRHSSVDCSRSQGHTGTSEMRGRDDTLLAASGGGPGQS